MRLEDWSMDWLANVSRALAHGMNRDKGEKGLTGNRNQ